MGKLFTISMWEIVKPYSIFCRVYSHIWEVVDENRFKSALILTDWQEWQRSAGPSLMAGEGPAKRKRMKSTSKCLDILD